MKIMVNKSMFILAGLIIFFSPGKSQYPDTIDLFTCYREAEKNHPLGKQKEQYREAYELSLKNASNNWYPELNANARASYQSDITAISADPVTLPIPGVQPAPQVDISQNIPTPKKDQYKMYMELNQAIYDGHATKRKKDKEDAHLQVNLKKNAVEIEKTKSQINQAYFSILALSENKKILEASLHQLNKQKELIKSGIQNGILLNADLMELETRILELNQQIREVTLRRRASVVVLHQLTDLELSYQTHFKAPQITINASQNIERPELELFEAQQQELETTKQLVQSQRHPKVYAFGQAGYGRPGLNMLSDEFDAYYLIGAGVKWNIWDWHESKNEREILTVSQQIVESQQQHFERNIRIALTGQLAEIDHFETLLKSDDEIIQAREKITSTAEDKLQNGTITTTEYLSAQLKEQQAKLKKALHEVQLKKAKINYLTTKGNL